MAGGSGTVFSTFGAKDHLGGRSTGLTQVRRYNRTDVQQSLCIGPALNGADPYQDTHTHTHTSQPILSASECRQSDRNQRSPAVRDNQIRPELGKKREGREGKREVGGGRMITIRQFQYLAWQPDVALVSTRFRPQCRHDWASDQLLILTLMFEVGLHLFRPWGPCFSRGAR